MTVAEKIEQAITCRPNSYVPARALLTLFGRHPGDEDKPLVWNHLIHYGTGAALGALRGVWAVSGIRRLHANSWHTVEPLGVDQTVENSTGAGAPPATWPRQELAVDVLRKAVFAAVAARRPTASWRGRWHPGGAGAATDVSSYAAVAHLRHLGLV